MTMDPQPKGMSGVWRLALFSVAIAGSGVLILIPWFELLAPVGLVIAGFIFIATGKPAAIDWSAFKAGAAVAVAAPLFIVLFSTFLWGASVSILQWMGWSFDNGPGSFSELSYSLRWLFFGPFAALFIATVTGFVMGGIGGLIAEMARDGVVCRAIQRARE